MKYFTTDIYKSLQKDKVQMSKAEMAYQKYLHETSIPKHMIRNLHMHDAVVKDLSWQDYTFVMDFAILHTQTAVYHLSFKEVNIIKNEGIAVGDFWINEEIYTYDKGYEIHILFADFESAFKEITIRAQNILFKFDEQKLGFQKRIQDLMHEYQNSTGDKRVAVEKQLQNMKMEYDRKKRSGGV